MAHGRQDEVATLLGALIFTIFTYLFYDTLLIPTTPLDPIDARLIARAFHYTLGLSVWLLVSVRLFGGGVVHDPHHRWDCHPHLSPSTELFCSPCSSLFCHRYFGRDLFLWRRPASFLLRLSSAHLAAHQLPLRAFGGYFHSSLGFYYLGLLVLWLVVGIYQHLRYRTGLMRLLPGARV